MAILYADDPADAAAWAAAIHALEPQLELRFWPDSGAAAEIDFAIVGGRAPGDLRAFPNLKAIQSTWAGVNHLLMDANLPSDRPLARMVDQGLTVSMTEFVVLHVLDSAREGPRLRAAQRARQWLELNPVSPRTITVAILGLGTLGADAGTRLAGLGFNVRGWSRSRKEIAGIQSFAGSDGLRDCLAGAHILVCLLPLTEGTRGILNGATFAPLARGAVLVHAARGAHLVEADLLAALDSGGLSRAILDVFAAEPLPGDHPFWKHPQVTVTPHVAAITRPGTGAADIIENYRRALAGEALINQVDRTKGY
ncbi:2-hydroxyacid dehydrogenase [Dongia deserti]|uniref:2-hydroxyacid dehydrogenase n=1 Tax=Dongia deserti TaxID=2268030 RepID=UPI000E6521B5|nr:glyoxylate/hydroxypyruvate reductase A [Dongia deserti]